MKQWMMLCGVVAVLTLGRPATAGEPEKSDGASDFPKCPVMGEQVDFAVSYATNDGPVYFCCKRCIKKYAAAPEKFAQEVAEQRKIVASLPKVQVTCPLTGKPINPKAFVDMGGRKVFACCKRCVAKLARGLDDYAAKIAASYTYQVKCPVKGTDIDPTVSLTVSGDEKVYFCCERCRKAFQKEPAKYAPKLEAQGYATLAMKLEEKTD